MIHLCSIAPLQDKKIKRNFERKRGETKNELNTAQGSGCIIKMLILFEAKDNKALILVIVLITKFRKLLALLPVNFSSSSAAKFNS